MANRPEVLKSFVPFYGAIVGPGSVDRRIKVMVYLALRSPTGALSASRPICPADAKPGSPKKRLQRSESEQDEGFSAPERAVIRYARELTRTARAEAGARGNVPSISPTSRSWR